jgi:hypothetical protein
MGLFFLTLNQARNPSHFQLNVKSAFDTKRYNNNSNSDTFENDEFLNRANLEKVLCSQLSNVKGVHDLYNSEGRKNVKDFILILGSKGPTRNVLLTDDMKEKIKEMSYF